MKRKISSVVLMVLLLNCANIPRHYLSYELSKPIIISRHVGEAIDLEEGEKYGLFLRVSDFKAATFYGIDDGGFEVQIMTENEKLLVVNRDSLAVDLLRDYIDRYDEIRKSRADFEEQWGIVDYDYLGLPITQHEVNRVSNNAGCVGCAGGASILVVVPSILLISVQGFGQQENVSGSIWLAAGILVASGAMGALVGRKLDKDAALKVIKEARKPQIVERF